MGSQAMAVALGVCCVIMFLLSLFFLEYLEGWCLRKQCQAFSYLSPLTKTGLHFMHRLISDDCFYDEALTSLSIFGKVEVRLERTWLHSQDELKGLDVLDSAALNLHASPRGPSPATIWPLLRRPLSLR